MEKIQVFYKRMKPFLNSKFMRRVYGILLIALILFTWAIINTTYGYYERIGFGWQMIKGMILSIFFVFAVGISFAALAKGYKGD